MTRGSLCAYSGVMAVVEKLCTWKWFAAVSNPVDLCQQDLRICMSSVPWAVVNAIIIFTWFLFHCILSLDDALSAIFI